MPAEYVPTADQRALVESASAIGITQAEIANQLNIDEKTLRKHFREELSSGKFKGYVWREATYASLSSIARAITGTAWNGPRFFGLRIDKGTTVSSDAADASPGAPNGRHLARDSGTRPRQAAMAQRPSDKSAAVMSPLHGGERKS